LMVLVIALVALVAAPIVVYLAEASERRTSDRSRDQRRISTQHPVMQY
jgi:hypothetical protein